MHADKTQENKVEDVTNAFVQRKSYVKPVFQFKDNRPTSTGKREIQNKLEERSTKLPIQKKENKTGLPDQLKSGIENLSGYAMDDVKVHYNSDKPGQLNAHAYAQGTNIHLASGQEKHLPHEAWHVVQQKQGRVKPTLQLNGKLDINDDIGLEKEADVMGNKILQNSKETNQDQDTVLLQGKFNQFHNLNTLLKKGSSILNVIQPKYIIRNKKIYLVDDDYIIKEGEILADDQGNDNNAVDARFKDVEGQEDSKFEVEDFKNEDTNISPELIKEILQEWRDYGDKVFKLLNAFIKEPKKLQKLLIKGISKQLEGLPFNLEQAIDMLGQSENIIGQMISYLKGDNLMKYQKNVRVIMKGSTIEAVMIWDLDDSGASIPFLAKNPLNMFPRSIAKWAAVLRSLSQRRGNNSLASSRELPNFDLRKKNKIGKVGLIALILTLVESRLMYGPMALKVSAGNDLVKKYYEKYGFIKVANGHSHDLVLSVSKQNKLVYNYRKEILNRLAFSYGLLELLFWPDLENEFDISIAEISEIIIESQWIEASKTDDL